MKHIRHLDSDIDKTKLKNFKENMQLSYHIFKELIPESCMKINENF